jgi:hypothetical protein
MQDDFLVACFKGVFSAKLAYKLGIQIYGATTDDCFCVITIKHFESLSPFLLKGSSGDYHGIIYLEVQYQMALC